MQVYYRRLRDMREDSDLTQQKVADILQIQRSLYNLYEQGKREIPLHMMIQLADLYRVSLDYMTGRTNRAENPNLILDK